MKKKLFIILFAILLIFTICKLYPKSGSFNDLVLSKYSQTQFTSCDIYKINTHKICMDIDKINEFLAFLKKVELIEYKGKIPYESNNSYSIGLYGNSSNLLGINIQNKNFIDIYIRTESISISKKYKIINNSLD
ncbi:MAG: hypothetical protein ACI8WT_004631, partial [Clostridium sp.]